MAAFFALIAGLAIGFMGGLFYAGCLLGYSETVRDWVKNVCDRIERGEDI
jgi:hypothetical protein